MTAVVAPPPSMGRLPSESNTSPEGSPNGFTAVNGKEPQSNGFHGKNGYGSSRPSSQHAQRTGSPLDYIRVRRDSSPSVSQSQASSDSGHKRKRSPIDEMNGYSPTSRYDYSPPKRLEHPQHVADRALQHLERTTPPSHQHTSNGHHRDNSHSWHGHQAVQSTSYPMNGVRHDPSETHMAEALQRATQDGSQSHSNWGTREGEQDDEERRGYSQDRTPQGTGPNGLKRKRNFSNRTKTGCLTCRKRKKKCDEAHPTCNNCSRGGFECGGYSNQRDVWKPAVVKPPVALQSKDGYKDPPSAEPTYKPDRPSPDSRNASTLPHTEGGQMRPITIDDNESGQHQFTSSPQSTEPRSRPSYSGQSWPPQGQQQTYNSDHLPPVSDMSRPEPSRPDHQVRREQPRTSSVSQQAPPPQLQGPQYPPPPPQQQQQQQQQQPPPPPPPPPQQQQPPPPPQYPPPQPNPSQGQWQSAPQTQPQPAYPPPQSYYPQPSAPVPTYQSQPRMDTSSSQTPSRMSTGASSSYQSGPRTFTAQEVEKSKMLRGASFNFLDPTLENERQRCEEALDRYNSACKLRNAAEASHREKLLEKVFDPSRDTLHHPIVPCKEKGTLGHRVKIEAPFTCTYGYNITLREDAFIGKNVTIDDAAVVDIGSRSWIGPGVTIITTDVSKDMVDRKGWESKWIAKPVYIGNEVVVGAGAVIYPGVHLARGSTVEPFAIVKHNLAENMTQQAIMAPRF